MRFGLPGFKKPVQKCTGKTNDYIDNESYDAMFGHLHLFKMIFFL